MTNEGGQPNSQRSELSDSFLGPLFGLVDFRSGKDTKDEEEGHNDFEGVALARVHTPDIG